MIRNAIEAEKVLKKTNPKEKVYKRYYGNIDNKDYYAFLISDDKALINSAIIVDATTGQHGIINGLLVKPLLEKFKEI